MCKDTGFDCRGQPAIQPNLGASCDCHADGFELLYQIALQKMSSGDLSLRLLTLFSLGSGWLVWPCRAKRRDR
jgi:hypothetical protein